jgi:hypothetical protein
MKRYRQVGLKQGKIIVCGEYGNLVAHRYGTDEKVSI